MQSVGDARWQSARRGRSGESEASTLNFSPRLVPRPALVEENQAPHSGKMAQKCSGRDAGVGLRLTASDQRRFRGTVSGSGLNSIAHASHMSC